MLSIQERLLILSTLAGAAHVLAPDHWFPASLLSWQKGWGIIKTAAFSTLILTFHVLLSFPIYYILLPFLKNYDSTSILLLALILIFAVMAIRSIRFSRLQEVISAGSGGAWGVFAVVSILGPCESIIPIWLKARSLGVGYFLPFAAFLAGTVAAGVSSIIIGRFLWDRPLSLPRGMALIYNRRSAVPVAAVLIIGLGVLLSGVS